MNNRGFAITTILYGTLILFCLLLVSMLGILSTYKSNLDKLINAVGGTRNVITIGRHNIDDISEISGRGLYCLNSTNDCQYYSGN